VDQAFLELLTNHYLHSSYIAHNLEEVLTTFHISCRNNGFHTLRIFLHENRILPFFEYYHLHDLSYRLGLDLGKKSPAYFDHPCYLINTGQEVYFTLMTSHPTSTIPRFGTANNTFINNTFQYCNPVFRMNSFHFYMNFLIINDVETLPLALRETSIDVLASDAIDAFALSWRTNNQSGSLLGFGMQNNILGNTSVDTRVQVFETNFALRQRFVGQTQYYFNMGRGSAQMFSLPRVL